MDRIIKVPRRTTAELYCALFITERSVDFVHRPSSWKDLAAFFVPAQREWLKCVELSIPLVPNLPHVEAQTLAGDVMPAALRAFWACLWPCPNDFRFTNAEIRFIRGALASFSLLVENESPEMATLGSLRRDLGISQWRMERQWFRRRAWDQLRTVDHYCRNPVLGPPSDVRSAIDEFCKL